MKCDPEILWTLVQQTSDPSTPSDVVVDHIESCVTCQKTLADLGGEATLWNEARECLSDVEIASAKQSDDWQPLPAIDLSFLGQSSHPEMLGRIGRYDVEAVLGRGGMGVVFRGYDSDLHRSVAIKVMAPEWAASLDARGRFAREAQAAASVSHENVIPIYNVESDADLPFLVMRYVRGLTLERWVRSNGPLDVATILRIASQLADGLAAAHRRGLIHRDIKPANVMVGDNTDQVWITDFGLARAADATTFTQTGVIAGTPHYMSPEQTRGESIDQRSDLFSLGCVLYFLCAGEPPLDAENTLAVLHRIVSDDPEPLTSVRDDLPPAFVSLVHQMLDRSARRRPADCDVVSHHLAVAQDEFAEGRVARPPASKAVRYGMLAPLAAAVCVSLGAPVLFAPTPPALKRSVADRPNSPSPVSIPAVSPYVARATEQIESAITLDSVNFKRRVDQIQQDVSQLEQWAVPAMLDVFGESDANWQRDLNNVQQELKRLEQ